MEVVSEVLAQLGVNNKPILTVYNKCDIIGEPFRERDSIAVSALTGMGMEDLKNAVTQELSIMRTEVSVLLPLASGALISRTYANGQVKVCKYQEDGIHINAVVSMEDATHLRAAAIKVFY
jgi:GTP-binding protein HflX